MLAKPLLGLPYTFPLLNSHSLVLLLGLFSFYLGLPWPISSIWASSMRITSLDILDPFHYYIPMGFLPNLSGFPGLVTIPFTNSFLWASSTHFLACFPFLMIPLGFLFLLWASLDPFAFFVSLLLLYRPMDHYSFRLGLMVFSYLDNPSSFTIFKSLGFFLLLGLFAKVGINIDLLSFGCWVLRFVYFS